MILRYFYDEKLAQASYLLGCGATGVAGAPRPDALGGPESANIALAALEESGIDAGVLTPYEIVTRGDAQAIDYLTEAIAIAEETAEVPQRQLIEQTVEVRDSLTTQLIARTQQLRATAEAQAITAPSPLPAISTLP